VSPDGGSVAYLQSDQSSVPRGNGNPRLSEVWVARGGAGSPVRVFTLPPVGGQSSLSLPSGDVEVVDDIGWTPDGRQLLVTTLLVSVSGGAPAAPRSRMLLVDVLARDRESESAPVELVTLPATVVRGSYTWAADGRWAAFLTRSDGGPGNSGFVALCAVDTGAGGAVNGFRYVADLGRQTDATSLMPVAPVAWAPGPDGRLVYTAATPKITLANPLGLPVSSGGDPGLFLATPSGPTLTAEEGKRLGPATGLIAPAWRSAINSDGPGLLAIGRSQQGSKPLVVRGIDAGTGAVQDLGLELPSDVGNGPGLLAARWDLAHGRLLVLAHRDGTSAGVLDYWLVQLQATQAGGD
jgi:hypothetical protein